MKMTAKKNPLTGDWLCSIPKTAIAYYTKTESEAKEFVEKVNSEIENGNIRIDINGHITLNNEHHDRKNI